MAGREREPFDRGPVCSLLWPLLGGLLDGLLMHFPVGMLWLVTLKLLWLRLKQWKMVKPLTVQVIECVKMHFPCEVLLLCAAWTFWVWLFTWWRHFQLASIISDWHRADLMVARKKLGIKFRRTPHPGRLHLLPCKLMVLSAVMLSMNSVAMAGQMPHSPPVTWVESVGWVRGLLDEPLPMLGPVRPPKCKSWLIDRSIVEEGKEADADEVKQKSNQETALSKEAEDAWQSFKIVTGCTSTLVQALERWDDLSEHVCCLSSCAPSFGPLGLLAKSDEFTAIVDTGASLTVSPHRDDFVTYTPHQGSVVKGLAKGSQIAGIGVVCWLVEVEGKTVELKIRALHVPESQFRLVCPQQLKKEVLNQWGVPSPGIEDDGVEFHFPEGTLTCTYNSSNLPEMKLTSPKHCKEQFKALNASLMMETNQNLTASQKELLRWHWKLGHIDLRRVQRLLKTGALGSSPLIKAAANVDLTKFPMLCGSCQFGKAKRKSHRPKREKRGSSINALEKILSKEVLIPGQKVSMDHFIVSTPGRLFSSRGSESTDRMFKGGVIFVDHASGFVWVEPVVNFTAGEALRAKRSFEREMASMGVTVINYHADNGVFTASEFQDELVKNQQGLTLSGVGAHHQNSMAERAIGTVVSMARTMMLHAKLRWPKAVSTKLWPMALKHAQHLMNHVPNINNVCALDLVLQTTLPRHALKNLHVWGCPAYVLQPKLQDGGHIPKFDPKSRRGLHLGWSPVHASTVPLVLNLGTGHVSPQFHVVFDDWFSTVNSDEMSPDDDVQGKQWTDLFQGSRFLTLFDEGDPVELDDEWLTELERLEKHQRAAERVRSNLTDPSTNAPVPPTGNNELPRVAADSAAPPLPGTTTEPADGQPPELQRESAQQRESLPQRESIPQRESLPTPHPPSQKREVKALQEDFKKKEKPKLRARPKAGHFKGMMIGLWSGLTTLMANESAMAMAVQTVARPTAQLAMNGFDAVTETFDHVDCLSFQALTASKSKGKKGVDPDFPTFMQAMMSPDVDEWKAAMKSEIKTLAEMDTWTVVPRSMATKLKQPVIKTLWAFRQKRDPAGLPTKKKARITVRGDIQKRMAKQQLIDEVPSYSPVVQWSTVRLMLILSIIHKLQTRQVDYVNAFAQAEVNRDVFIEIPDGFDHANNVDCVLKLNKSLYGMSDAPLMFFELLKENLTKVGFKQQTEVDPCLFIHKKAICVTYVDDCLWFGKDGTEVDRLIAKMRDKMDLKVESDDVSAFLGIQFTREGDTIELKQLGLIDKIIEATGMQDANPKDTPAEPKTLGKDKDGAPFRESWSMRSVVGMLLYLSGNSRPDIAFAVHQAARFSHDPKQSHAEAVKRIVRYLIGTRNKGMRFKPTNDWKVDCFVDADFCGLWGSEDPEDPIVSKSRTGFIITLAGCPLMWASKLQTETAVSTMHAEYVALSHSMREMLPLKRLVKTVAKVVTGDDNVKMVTKSDVFEDNNGALTVATMPRITPQSKFFAVKLHFFKEHVRTPKRPDAPVEIQKIETTKQLADIMTKGLVKDKFVPLRDSLMGWDMDDDGNSKLLANLHSRGSVENVSLVPSLLKALIVELDYM